MSKPMMGQKLAVLVANGFSETDLMAAQRTLQKAGVNVRIVSMDQGLVNSWNGTGWGLNYAADYPLNAALAADFDILLIPGGQRSIDKLKLTAHTKRFINGFMNAHKPVIAFDEALDLLIFCEKVQGRTVTGPAAMQAPSELAGATWSTEPFIMDSNLMTGGAIESSIEDFVKAVSEQLVSVYAEKKAA
jgi:protease I